MSLENFKLSPWKSSHESYKDSALSISPAPEYANAEVMLAGLYRTIGFGKANEGSIPQNGRELEKKIQKYSEKQKKPETALLDAGPWRTVLHGILESPKLPNQSLKRFLQVTPLVPAMALFSGSARLSSNSWPAGSLVMRMIWLGSKDDDAAKRLWKDLFSALDVTKTDDIFARWLQQETMTWLDSPHEWQLVTPAPNDVSLLQPSDYASINFPAKQFAKDLASIIQAKDSMTRRQWTSMLEAVIRLASVAHVLWLCDVQGRIWKCIGDALDGKGPIDEEQARQAIFPTNLRYMNHGDRALPGMRDHASSYLLARLGTNTLLWTLDAIKSPHKEGLSSSRDIAHLCKHIRDNKEGILANGFLKDFETIKDQEARPLRCKKGIGSNILEFMRHVLGQRQTANALLRGYDQGFILRKKGESAASPWVVSLGPVAVLALVHCALAGMGGPRSIHRLSKHLASYGIDVGDNIASSDLGHQLRMLGLVLDSPDAESGMLLLPPFPTTNHKH